MFTNDPYPRAVNADGTPQTAADWVVVETRVRAGARLAATRTILCGVGNRERAIVGGGRGITKNVPAGRDRRRRAAACSGRYEDFAGQLRLQFGGAEPWPISFWPGCQAAGTNARSLSPRKVLSGGCAVLPLYPRVLSRCTTGRLHCVTDGSFHGPDGPIARWPAWPIFLGSDPRPQFPRDYARIETLGPLAARSLSFGHSWVLGFTGAATHGCVRPLPAGVAVSAHTVGRGPFLSRDDTPSNSPAQAAIFRGGSHPCRQPVVGVGWREDHGQPGRREMDVA